jgi:alpha-beta hydrolase superfamily lysophospholipase
MIPQILLATLLAAPGPRQHIVPVEGQPMTVWEKRPDHPRGAILLLHGRTWSSLPDFDLQVPGERLSLMDALVERGFDVYALDARGYGATPRDSTGWLTPLRAAQDAIEVLKWIEKRSPGDRRPVLFGWSRGSMVAHLAAQLEPDAMSALILFGYPVMHLGGAADTVSGPPPRIRNTAALAADPVRVDWRRTYEFETIDPTAVHVPTLVMHGERDPLYAEYRDAQARWFSLLGTNDKTWVILPHADHAALLEAAAPRFVQAMLTFLERPRAPGSEAQPTQTLTLQWDTVATNGTDALHVLFIGNSYTYFNDLPRLVGVMSTAPNAPRRIVAGMVVAGGARLRDLWDDPTARAAIHARHWDYVVLQEQSTLASPDPTRFDTINFYPYARRFDREIKSVGARTMMYMTWARRTAPQTQAKISEAYRHLAHDLGATLVPVGEAWAAVERDAPSIALHQPDNSHPTPAGSYLAACLFYATLLHADPVGLPSTITGVPVDIGGRLIGIDNGGPLETNPSTVSVALVNLDEPIARTVQRAAWETVRARAQP